VSFNGSVVRENIQKTSINENGTIVRTEKGLFQLNEKSGELVNTHLEKDKAEFCTSWQERAFIRLNEIDPSVLCNSEFSHYIEAVKMPFISTLTMDSMPITTILLTTPYVTQLKPPKKWSLALC